MAAKICPAGRILAEKVVRRRPILAKISAEIARVRL